MTRLAAACLLLAAAPAAAGELARDKLLFYRDGDAVRPVRTPADWARRRADVLAGMTAVMGPLPGADRRVPLDVKVEAVETLPAFTRTKLTFAAEPGDRVAAYLLVPAGLKGKAPAVLCLHPTSVELGKGVPAGFGPKPDRHYAVHLAERGYVTLAPDYPGSGDSKCDPYKLGYRSATMKAVWNHARCVDLLQSLPEVDGGRVGVIGHSLGGHNALFAAAFDERLRCVVSNCGFCSFPTYMKGKIAPWGKPWYMPRVLTAYGADPARMPFDFPEVVAAVAPRALLASAPVRDHNFDAQGVKDCVAAARPVYELLGAADRLSANYPDADHNFPEPVRAVAYAWLDRWLKK